MKKSRVWQAIVPGTETKPQDTLQIRKTPWHGVTKQPPAAPLPGPNVTLERCCSTPERNEKIKVLAGIPLLGHRAPLFQAQKSVHRALKTLRAGISAGNSTVAATELHCSRHRNLCTEQKHFGVGFLDKEAVAHLMATIDTTEHTISGRAPPCCTTGSADLCRLWNPDKMPWPETVPSRGHKIEPVRVKTAQPCRTACAQEIGPKLYGGYTEVDATAWFERLRSEKVRPNTEQNAFLVKVARRVAQEAAEDHQDMPQGKCRLVVSFFNPA